MVGKHAHQPMEKFLILKHWLVLLIILCRSFLDTCNYQAWFPLTRLWWYSATDSSVAEFHWWIDCHDEPSYFCEHWHVIHSHLLLLKTKQDTCSTERWPTGTYIAALLAFKIKRYPHKYPQIIKVPLFYYLENSIFLTVGFFYHHIGITTYSYHFKFHKFTKLLVSIS